MAQKNTLYTQLGGAAALDAAVELFYEKVLDDIDLAPFLTNTDMDKQKVHQKAFLTRALGGKSGSKGRGLKTAHRGLGIADRHFNIVAGHLISTLEELGVGPDLVDEVITAVAGLRSEIVDPEPAGQSQDSAASAPTERQIVIFRMGIELFGIDIDLVREIIRHQNVTRAPKAATGLLGVINLRGQATPVMALDTLLSLSSSSQTKDTRIVVVDIDGRHIGMVVDEVTKVVRFSPDVVSALPPTFSSETAYVHGIARLDEGLTILLDIEKVALDVDTGPMIEKAA